MSIRTESESEVVNEFIHNLLRELQAGNWLDIWIGSGTDLTHCDLQVLLKGIPKDLLEGIVAFVVAMTMRDVLVPPDYTRVVRIVEYVGPRADVEKQIANSLEGTRKAAGASFVTARTLGTERLSWRYRDRELAADLACAAGRDRTEKKGFE